MNARVMQAARSVGIIGATVALISGVTFAALTSNSVTLSDNTISSATASLLISNGGAFSTNETGFHVTGLVPGTGSTPNNFYLENNGGVALALTAHVPTAPAAPVGGYGFTGFENLKVTITNKNTGTSYPTNMAALLAGEVPLDTINAGVTGTASPANAPGDYSVSYDINPSAITGSHAGVDSFNLVFSGTQTP